MNHSSVKSRQPKRTAWPIERLIHERSIALGFAIDNTSAQTYGSAVNSYIEFCRLHNFSVEPTIDTFTFYIVFMSRHIDPRSVDSYLSGICNQLEDHWPDVRNIRKSPLVSKTLKGYKRLWSKEVKRKHPLSREQLNDAFTKLPQSPSYDDILWIVMLFTGFFALLRLGEMAMHDNPAQRNPRKYVRRLSASCSPSQYEFLLPGHKADPFFEGNRVLIKDQTACNLFLSYIQFRDAKFPLNPYLWLCSNGSPPTRAWFIRRLRHFFPNTNIAGQSMRAGGATALAEDGAPPHIIQSAGRWASNTFHIYIRKHPTVLHAMLLANKSSHRESTI
jgi:hypothetical protein